MNETCCLVQECRSVVCWSRLPLTGVCFCAAICSWSWAGCAMERVHAAMTLCRNLRATTGGLSMLESNPANPTRNTVIKSASLCRHCHTQPPSPPKKAAISHTIPSRCDPSNRSSRPSSRVIGVVCGMKWWAVGELAVVWSYVMILKGLGCSGFGSGGGGGLWVGHFFCTKPLVPLWNGHSKATLQLNGENSNAPLENSGHWESPSNGSSPCLWKGGSRVNVMQQTEWAQWRHQHTLTCTPDSLDSLAAMLLRTPHTPVSCRQIWKILVLHLNLFLLSKVAAY